MPDTDNVVLEHLHYIRSAVDALRGDMGILENQYASLSSRLDRLDAPVERIERRLDLADA